MEAELLLLFSAASTEHRGVSHLWIRPSAGGRSHALAESAARWLTREVLVQQADGTERGMKLEEHEAHHIMGWVGWWWCWGGYISRVPSN